ncbi:type II secretion system F family protein [Lichenihabitans sp. Uapishka_5]|uniref:type II secretion system F family protein n=1 Tax=Lichenihabitans sp. Uapishka_5 TaxID=3037302 RepID=UPI0029E81160|nr:type II secretion system F family protein [Lichenihabitans sp. Uapishka_5]MDX7953083.1 type II secretion system F family protein [Lichenihabitans sp. Uapishka_5]
MDQHLLMTVVLAGIAVVATVLVAFPGLFSDNRAEQRQKSIGARPIRTLNDASRDPNARRKQVSDSLKDLDKRAGTKPTLEIRLTQAGMTWTRRTYMLVSAGLGLGLGAVVFVCGGSPLVAGGSALIGAFGMPRWMLTYRRNRRFKQFRHYFPEALDMITRGVKAGLPLNDCLRAIAREAQEPVRSEFRAIVQAQGIGLPVGEAAEKMAERMPIPEANFFAIVIAIQSKAGGNLSEALNNLSRVLRDRKKMEGKVKAMSSEAKASAGIIGCLPFVVGTLVYLSSPQYMSLLFTTDTGHMVMLGSAVWMGMGILVIKKMVSFDI